MLPLEMKFDRYGPHLCSHVILHVDVKHYITSEYWDPEK